MYCLAFFRIPIIYVAMNQQTLVPFYLNFHQSFIISKKGHFLFSKVQILKAFSISQFLHLELCWFVLTSYSIVRKLATKVRVDTDTTDHTLIFAAQNFVMESPNCSTVAPLQTILQLSGVFDCVIYYFLLQFFNF